ncbi:MAG: hypothetical protein RB148_04705 [Armatimonadota bacterium]|nr:hypothetical protein [Armatimonadota bacterium]
MLLGGSAYRSAAAGQLPGAPFGIGADIRVGYGGYVVPDVWIPVALRLRSDREISGQVEVVTERLRPASRERVRVPVHLLPGVPLRVTVPAVVRDPRAPITVRLLEQEAVSASWQVAIPPGRLADAVVLALTARPVSLQHLLDPGGRLRVAYIGEEDLPARWQLYEGVAAVVIRDLADHRLVPAQVEALAGWVASGGRVLIAASPAELAAHPSLRPFLAAATLPPAFPGAPETVYGWGRGRVTVLPFDPFRSYLPPEEAAAWMRLLRAPRPPAFVEARSLLAVLPDRAGATRWQQGMVVLVLVLYLALLGTLLRWLQGGRAGRLLAAVLLLGITVVMSVLNLAARRSAVAFVQGAVALALPDRQAALVESVGRVLLPRRGTFSLRAEPEVLARPLAGAETSLLLDQMVRFEGTAQVLPVHAAALVPLPARGSYRAGAEGVEVQFENRSGRRLRDPVVFLGGRIQPVPPPDPEVRALLSPLRWREPPADGGRDLHARLRAWTFSRLRSDAILSPTVYLVAWLDDDRGLLRRPGRAAAPLLLVVPLSRAESVP